MRKWVAALAVVAMPAMADDHEACSMLSELAEGIMELRQDGYPMRDLIDQYIENGIYSERVQLIIREAYERPAARSESYRQRQKTEFGNIFYMSCMPE